MHPENDELVPDPKVCKEFGVTAMTIWRWERDPKLGFPPKIKINTRNYRSRRGLNEFRVRQAMTSASAAA